MGSRLLILLLLLVFLVVLCWFVRGGKHPHTNPLLLALLPPHPAFLTLFPFCLSIVLQQPDFQGNELKEFAQQLKKAKQEHKAKLRRLRNATADGAEEKEEQGKSDSSDEGDGSNGDRPIKSRVRLRRTEGEGREEATSGGERVNRCAHTHTHTHIHTHTHSHTHTLTLTHTHTHTHTHTLTHTHTHTLTLLLIVLNTTTTDCRFSLWRPRDALQTGSTLAPGF